MDMRLVPIDVNGRVEMSAVDRTGSVKNVIEQTVAMYGRRGFEDPWVGYLAIEDDTWVGACSFTSPPTQGEVEIAYFTFPGLEGHGVASRMAARLLDLTERRAVRNNLTYIAYTLPQESASTSILRKLGFKVEGSIIHPEDGEVWKWRRMEML